MSISSEADISRAISQVFPSGNTDTVRHLRRTEALVIRVEEVTYLFSTDKSNVFFDLALRHPQGLSQVASKTLEVVGKDLIALAVTACHTDLTNEMWEAFLHGLTRLELISHRHYGEGGSQRVIDPFVSVFSRPSEGGQVCPNLRCLKLPMEVLIKDPSCTVLKRVLTERKACNVGLKWVGLSSDATEKDNGLVLETFQDLVYGVR